MLGDHMCGDGAGTSSTASSAARSSKEENSTSKDRAGPGVKPPKGNGVRVAQLVSGIIAQLDKAISPRLQEGGERGEACDRSSFDEDDSSKQPLLVKSCSCTCTSARSHDLSVNSADSRQDSVDEARRHSWVSAARVARERDNAEAEARGEGAYSLHAVLGQGSFGRIHLASWRREGGSTAAVFGLNDESLGSIDHANSCETRPEQVVERIALACAAGQAAAVAAAVGAAAPALAPASAGGRDLFPWTPQCKRCILREEDGWGGERGVLEAGAAPRLRALKSVCKRKVTEKGLVRHVETELAVLKQCSHPFIVALSPGGQFQTSRHLHLVLEYCPGGDLVSLLGREGRLAEPQARVCAAQLALALRHLHDRHIAYRDLKPENVCLNARGHAILVDFSLAKTGLDLIPGAKAYTFCGSAAYAAPEMLAQEGHDTRVDLWSLGCVIFETLVGTHPFRRPRGERSDRQALFERIRLGRPEYPSFLSAPALSLLRGLLTVDPDDRLGFGQHGLRSPKRRQRDAPTAQITTRAAPPAEPSTPSLTPTTLTASSGATHPARGGNHPSQDPSGYQCVRTNGAAAASRENPRTGATTEPDGSGSGTTKGGNGAASPEVELADHILQGVDLSRESAGAGVELRASSAGQLLLLEHAFFRGLPGWGGPGTNGAWDDEELKGSAVIAPALRDALDVRHFDPRFTSQDVELILQGHPHKGGPTPNFDDFGWRADRCIEYAQVEDRGSAGFLGSISSVLWC